MHQGAEHKIENQSANFTALRWKLKADAFFIRVADGVELQNSKGSYQIRGKAAYTLIDWIFRGFQNPASLDELCAGMPVEKKAAIARQVKTLKDRGFLREVTLPLETLPPWAEAFSEVIAFIHQFEDAPFSRFQAFREKRFLCSGPASVAFLEGLAAYGAQNIDVVVPQDVPGAMEAIAAFQERIQPADLKIQASTSPEASLNGNGIFFQKQGFDCMLLSGPMGAGPDLGRICASVLGEGKPLSIVAYSGNRVVASPFFTPTENFCWECMHRTIHLEHSAGGRQGTTPAALALACNHVIHNLFCYYTGIDRPLLSHCAVVNCDTLAVSIHPITRHPACPHHERIEVRSASFHLDHDRDFIRPDLPDSDDPADLIKIQDQIISWSDQLTDKVVGPFLALEEGNLPQLPLSASRCVVRTLASTAGKAESREIVARGISTREARNQVALFGLECLAGEVIDARTTVACRLLERLDALCDEGSRLTATVGAGWSAGEAIYRALHGNALAWTAGAAEGETMHAMPPQFIQNSSLMQYFASFCPELLAPGLSVQVGRAPSGMAIARLATPSGTTPWGAGLNKDHACENAAAELANRHSAGGTKIALLRTVYRLGQSGTWLEALQRNGIEVPRHLDAAALLPACRDKVFLALIKA